jgi:hypothetical protein
MMINITKEDYMERNEFLEMDGLFWETEANGELQTLYKDGQFTKLVTFDEIRKRLKENGK